MLRGMANVSYWAEDLLAARQWYSQVFGQEPYYQMPNADTPGYIEYRIGDYQHEVGIISKSYQPELATNGPGGVVLYWHVDDLSATLDQLLSMGATLYQPITDHSQGQGNFVTASVLDPFGNVLGIMYNQHYLDIYNQKHAQV